MARRLSPDAPLPRLLTRAEGLREDVGGRVIGADGIARLRAVPHLIRREGDRWRLTPEGRELVRAETPPDRSPNRGLVLAKSIAGLDNEEIHAALVDAGWDISRNRVAAWLRHATDRRHVKITWEELLDVLEALEVHLPPLDDDGEKG